MTGSSGSPTEPRIGSFGVPSFLLASRFPSVPLADHESVLRARSGPCRVGRRGKAARSRGRSCHRTGRAAPAAHSGRGNPGLATGARVPASPAAAAAAARALPPPTAKLLYPRPLPRCSRRPPPAPPIRREHSQQAPANPRPAFAGNAKPLGEKQ